MASFRSFSSANANSTSVTISLPSGVVDNDLLFLHLPLNTQGTTITDGLTGWTLIQQYNKTGGNSASFALYRKIANNEPVSYTLTLSGSSRVSPVITVWSGVDTTTPIATYATSDYFTSDTTLRYKTVTTTANNQLVVLLGAFLFNPSPTSTPPTDFTEAVDYQGSRASTFANYREYSTINTTTGDLDSTISSSIDAKLGWTLVLNNAVADSTSLPPFLIKSNLSNFVVR